MAADVLSAYSASSQVCPELFKEFVFSAFTMILCLVYRGEWSDLASGNPGVWSWALTVVQSRRVFVTIRCSLECVPSKERREVKHSWHFVFLCILPGSVSHTVLISGKVLISLVGFVPPSAQQR
jgi:hypothetical protein